jgi:glycosyltransferase involved in cell wall biosynthesis
VRIAHLVIGGDVAGGQLVALQLARAARARGHEPWFAAPEDGAFTEQVRDEGFAVELVDLSRTFKLNGAVRLARLLRATRTDLLHTHTQLAPNILGRLAARGAGARVVSHIHIESYFRPGAVGRLYHRPLDNATARLCHAVITVSEDTRRALVEQGYPAERIFVVHNGIELDGAAPSPPQGRTVVEVARLAPVKGQRELIEAIAQVPDARLVLVGKDLEQDGAYAALLKRRARELGVADRVELAGYRPDALGLMREARVVALPSTTEGLPIVLLEAMAQARPVVATPVGGTPELVVDGETGLLVPPGDIGALARALRELLDDDELARRLGESGRRRVEERFSAGRMADAVLKLYE